MSDRIIKISSSTIQHGPLNDRVYIMYVDPKEAGEIFLAAEKLALDRGYSKIFSKMPKEAAGVFLENGYITEAVIPGYYGTDDAAFVSRFLTRERETLTEAEQNMLSKVLVSTEGKPCVSEVLPLQGPLSIQRLSAGECTSLASLYREVFPSYPFPIHDPEYLNTAIQNGTVYFGCYDKDVLIGASSAEPDTHAPCAEMTDFAVQKNYRGNNISLHLLDGMETHMKEKDIRVCYTICRAVSFGMNAAFKKLGYSHSGTLIHNTDISGSIESMNVWYKAL
ncbi:MAG: putative beta-lysine N-acetyltransferase [Spirochaetales bacterium]|nr:putative beta-lysine N-acetyltransferase [Spirochaetales bacterium]